MNITKLIPIDFSRKITPFVIYDLIWDDVGKSEFLIKEDFLQLYHFNNSTFNDDHLYVISFADRPNTGTQPVGDDVIVDMVFDDGDPKPETGAACEYEFSLSACGDDLIKTWKPNRASMLKQWQAEQRNKEQAHHIALQEGDTVNVSFEDVPHAIHQKWDVVPVGDGIGKGEVAHNDGELKLVKAKDKPVFTQAMCDANNLPKVGAYCRYKLKGGVNWFDCRVIHYHKNHVWIENITAGSQPLIKLSNLSFAPVKTYEHKLSDAIFSVVEGDAFVYSCPSMIDKLMASDLFTITLNESGE